MFRNKEFFFIPAFEFQIENLFIYAAGIARKTVIRPHYPMTRHYKVYIVFTHSRSDGLRGHSFQPVIFGDLLGDLVICNGCSVMDPVQNVPHFDLKRRAYHMNRRFEIGLFALKINIEPMF